MHVPKKIATTEKHLQCEKENYLLVVGGRMTSFETNNFGINSKRMPRPHDYYLIIKKKIVRRQSYLHTMPAHGIGSGARRDENREN